MSTPTDDKLSALLTGVATSTAYHFLRRDSDNQNRMDQQRDDIDVLHRRMQELQANGHWLRDSSAVVADFLSGIALARSEEQTPSVLPNMTTISRPQLISALTAGIGSFMWPPKEGEYTPNGYIKKAGELVSLGLILTFEEVRAILHGFVLDEPPTQAQKITAFYAAAELMRAIVAKGFTREGWRATWERLFGPTAHDKAPVLADIQNNVQVQALAGAKDSAMVLKLTVGGGGVNAGAQLAKVAFGTPYVNTPAVIAGGPFRVELLTNKEFVIMTTQAMNPGDIATVPVIVGSTDG